MYVIQSQATLLRAGGFGAGAPPSPARTQAHSEEVGSIICHMSLAETGQIAISLRPLYELYNGLPCSIGLRLAQPGASEGKGAHHHVSSGTQF